MKIVDILNASLAGRYAVYRQVGEGGMATVYPRPKARAPGCLEGLEA
jgi:hypothetical protein